MKNPKLQARIAGLLYLFVVASSVFALVTTSGLIAPGDVATTLANLDAAEFSFRLAFVANLAANIAYVAVVAILYSLFEPVNRTLSTVAGYIGLAGCAVSGASMINVLSTLYIGDAALQAAFTPEQLQALARMPLRLGGLGNSVCLVFFGCYCLALAALVFNANFLPKILGVFLLLAGAGWLVGNVATFLAPSLPFASVLLPVSGLGELAFALWLVGAGVNSEKWRAQASDAMC